MCKQNNVFGTNSGVYMVAHGVSLKKKCLSVRCVIQTSFKMVYLTSARRRRRNKKIGFGVYLRKSVYAENDIISLNIIPVYTLYVVPTYYFYFYLRH